ncbi:MAG: DNA-binding protein WhiA [Clostridiales Family XIII bacterium]|jgi:DNA-binding protein WhiA|nr:DNA-binding protein WhiA [Clostridiales Family XIII bacterium]
MMMSFSSEVKNEIAHGMPEKECCRIAEAAGFVRTAGALKPAGRGEVGLSAVSGNPAVARHVKSLLAELSVEPGISVSVANTGGRISSKRYIIEMPAAETTFRLLSALGIIERKDGLLSITVGIPQSAAYGKCCRKSYLRGMFLGSGSVADPERSYHFEILAGGAALAADTRRLMNSFSGIHAGVSQRRDKSVVYLKSAEQIKDMLGILGAHAHLLAFEDVRMIHEMKGAANRISNCDNANVDRSIRASNTQMKMIARIERSAGGLAALPQKLREAACLRRDNPEASLTELGALMNPPVGKAAAAARFARLEKAGKL